MEFLAALIDALAWPAAIVAIGLMFRRKIAELLARDDLESLRAGPVQLVWRRLVADATADLAIERSEDPTKTLLLPAGPITEELKAWVRISPEGAVLLGYGRVEQGLRVRAIEVMGDGARSSPLDDVFAKLLEVRMPSLMAGRAMRHVRNMYALALQQPKEITPDEALLFLGLCDRVFEHLDNPPKRSGSPA